ncbi:hypothetical protein DNHGIG_22900 [Collibacillus ludicampi]|uniref:Uncharacterized protein n=1 Tax=Collibacillus ludicampi TaxID=2771369 RepID=A0AAV4LFY2_9BACL|nr:hypothetical protein [Collibacillus ludicampi]GIM46741.1 hypothetical protein DNHGIG_22900 [Collibacillus ludicampi]
MKMNQKKWIPLTVLSSLATSAVFGTAAMASTSEPVSHAKIVASVQEEHTNHFDKDHFHVKINHGQRVSEVATSLPGGPGKGAVVREVAHDKDDQQTLKSDDDKQATKSDDDKQAAKSDDDKQAAKSDEDKQAAKSDDDKQAAKSDDDKQAAKSDDDKQAAKSQSKDSWKRCKTA